MEIIHFFTKFISNPDEILFNLIKLYSNWIYLFLFLIIFAETGLIILSFLMPFLPGDALLFSIGIVTANGELSIYIIIPLLIFAAILGDNFNYFIGRKFSKKKIFNKYNFLILKDKHLKKAKFFLKKNGKLAIIFARFIPVVRTILPFLSGVTKLPYQIFFLYSIIGGVIWVVLLILIGYMFGQFSFVKNNLEKVIIIIIIIVNIPILRQIFIKLKK